MVLLPLPVRPTRPIFSFAATLNDTFFSTGSRSAAYLITTSSNSIPSFSEGQSFGGRLSVMRGGSGGSSMYSEMRSAPRQLLRRIGGGSRTDAVECLLSFYVGAHAPVYDAEECLRLRDDNGRKTRPDICQSQGHVGKLHIRDVDCKRQNSGAEERQGSKDTESERS